MTAPPNGQQPPPHAQGPRQPGRVPAPARKRSLAAWIVSALLTLTLAFGILLLVTLPRGDPSSAGPSPTWIHPYTPEPSVASTRIVDWTFVPQDAYPERVGTYERHLESDGKRVSYFERQDDGTGRYIAVSDELKIEETLVEVVNRLYVDSRFGRGAEEVVPGVWCGQTSLLPTWVCWAEAESQRLWEVRGRGLSSNPPKELLAAFLAEFIAVAPDA
ncbi:MAG: hypothetical protein Q4F65_02170 [Propionibacteriaceae bacterium]|nr:hypothetical protein [Propionibacteriaceae bacterium]